MATKSHYTIEDFIAACDAKKRVRVDYQALQDARIYYGLHTEDAIKEFIVNGGLETLVLEDSIPLRAKFPELKIIVDSYKFRTGLIPSYIAFYYQPITKYWIIKSFKPDRDCDPTIAEKMKAAFAKSETKKIEKENGKEK